MLLDKQNQFSDQQAVTATADATNVIDLGPFSGGNTSRDLGINGDLYLLVLCTEAAAASGAATVTFAVTTDDNAALSSDTTIATSAAIGKATMVAGWTLQIPLPTGTYERYLGLTFTVATGPLTAGKFSAWINRGKQTSKVYQSGITNSV